MTKPNRTTKRATPPEPPANEAADVAQMPPRFTKGGEPGPGRPKGSMNRTTLVMKNAIAIVFEKLQAKHGKEGEFAHFFSWAEGNPTDFYRIAAKLIPLTLEQPARLVGRIVFRGING